MPPCPFPTTITITPQDHEFYISLKKEVSHCVNNLRTVLRKSGLINTFGVIDS